LGSRVIVNDLIERCIELDPLAGEGVGQEDFGVELNFGNFRSQ
jgi:hypothetical protein